MGTQLIRNIKIRLLDPQTSGKQIFRFRILTINLFPYSLGGIETSELIDIRQRFNFHLFGDLFAEFKAFAVRR